MAALITGTCDVAGTAVTNVSAVLTTANIGIGDDIVIVGNDGSVHKNLVAARPTVADQLTLAAAYDGGSPATGLTFFIARKFYGSEAAEAFDRVVNLLSTLNDKQQAMSQATYDGLTRDATTLYVITS